MSQDDRFSYLHTASLHLLDDDDDKLGWDLPDDDIHVPLHLLPPYQDEEDESASPRAARALDASLTHVDLPAPQPSCPRRRTPRTRTATPTSPTSAPSPGAGPPHPPPPASSPPRRTPRPSRPRSPPSSSGTSLPGRPLATRPTGSGASCTSGPSLAGGPAPRRTRTRRRGERRTAMRGRLRGRTRGTRWMTRTRTRGARRRGTRPWTTTAGTGATAAATGSRGPCEWTWSLSVLVVISCHPRGTTCVKAQY